MRTEITFEEVQYRFMIKNPKELEIERTYLSIIEGRINKPMVKFLLSGNLKAFPPESGMRHVCSQSRLLFTVVWKGWDRTPREERAGCIAQWGQMLSTEVSDPSNPQGGRRSWLLKVIPPTVILLTFAETCTHIHAWMYARPHTFQQINVVFPFSWSHQHNPEGGVIPINLSLSLNPARTESLQTKTVNAMQKKILPQKPRDKIK